ncbi:MAG: methyltransferase domain-containing protein [Lachnospiraceae bacterium]|nr:methyltransferase domain-containing protein [Lachnospiraceae bacterium]
MQFAVFGAGEMGVRALFQIGKEGISCFIDNKRKGNIEGIPIYSVEEYKDRFSAEQLIFITSKKYRLQMEEQLKQNGLDNFVYFTPDRVMNSDVSKKLTADEWGHLYNSSLAEKIANKLERREYSIQTRELLKLTAAGDKVLEIGCGSGETSAGLAMNGRKVSALDYSEGALNLVKNVCSQMGCGVNIYHLNATEKLPFCKNEFDCIFQAGLLEHFIQKERIEMLKNWNGISEVMVSFIPNSHSIPYQMGKKLAEDRHTWPYGLEMPQFSLREDFELAGYREVEEYTIGIEAALHFLPSDHYLRAAFEKAIAEGIDLCEWGQGYLLVTVGKSC